jgi:hypothetical protein
MGRDEGGAGREPGALKGRAARRAEAALARIAKAPSPSTRPRAGPASTRPSTEGSRHERRPSSPILDFAARGAAAEDGEALIVDIDGYEGPLHVLLALARSQKVDLLKLSVLKLAEQYLAFVQDARSKRFSLAADYLVMASWLAYLKSRLLLPKPEQPKGEEAPAEEIATRLAFRLAKLDAMRNAAES